MSLDTSSISKLSFIGEANLLEISSDNLFQISIFFNNWPGDPFAEFIKSWTFICLLILYLRGSKYSFELEVICFTDKDLNLTIWHLEIIVSKRIFNFDVTKIKIPLLGSSNVFNRQLDADSFKRCASIIKTIFFSEFIDFWPRKFLILRIWAILIISDPLFVIFSRSGFLIF